MYRLLFAALIIAQGCATRTIPYSKEALESQPRYCGDPAYAPTQEGLELLALATVAVVEPGTYRCRPTLNRDDEAVEAAARNQP